MQNYLLITNRFQTLDTFFVEAQSKDYCCMNYLLVRQIHLWVCKPVYC